MSTIAMGVETTYGISYLSAGEADNYFDDMLFPEPWNTLDESMKEKALVAATRKIDSQMLIGRKASFDQTLEFPRALYSDTPTPCQTAGERSILMGGVGFYNLPGWVAETEISQDVKDACCEEALSLLRSGIQVNKRAELQRMGVKSFSLGPLSESYTGASMSGNTLTSVVAAQLLKRYTGGSRTIS